MTESFLAKKVKKWLSHKNLVEKNVLVGIDSEYLETYFKTKISKSKVFPITKFFLGLSRFLAKIVKKWQSQKFLVENFFGRNQFRTF